MMKRILLGVFSLAVVLGTAGTSQAQYHHHHRHCCGSIITASAERTKQVRAN
jgi:hypothetical protein